MKPVRTITSNLVYVGPPGVGDLHCQRVEPGLIRSVWHPTALQRRAIADGANIALWVYTEPIPPVAVTVTNEQGIGEDSPEIAARIEAWAIGADLTDALVELETLRSWVAKRNARDKKSRERYRAEHPDVHRKSARESMARVRARRAVEAAAAADSVAD